MSTDSVLIWENIRENFYSHIIYLVLILLASFSEEILQNGDTNKRKNYLY